MAAERPVRQGALVRFGIDFVSLRQGGATHPFLMPRFLTGAASWFSLLSRAWRTGTHEESKHGAP